MQRSLLPRTRPRMAGLEIGAIYESSALVGVGGDIYDYLQTDDDRLAIVLGDVTGHGIDAAADMAMAKFVFRSLARLYPEPGAFLGAANDVVVEEIGAGKFITMLYLTIDLGRGEVACASAGHPPPRLLDASGAVSSLDAKGLVLGIAPGTEYSELRRPFEPGASAVLYTDGLVEARRAGEMYGEERLDRVLAEQSRAAARAARRGRARGVPPLGRRRPPGRLRDRRRAAFVKESGFADCQALTGNLTTGSAQTAGRSGSATRAPPRSSRRTRCARCSAAVELGCDLSSSTCSTCTTGRSCSRTRTTCSRSATAPSAGRVRRPDPRRAARGRARASDLRRGAGAARRDGRRRAARRPEVARLRGRGCGGDPPARSRRTNGGELLPRRQPPPARARRAGARARAHVPVRPTGCLAAAGCWRRSPPSAVVGLRAALPGRVGEDARSGPRATRRCSSTPSSPGRRSSALTRAARPSSPGPWTTPPTLDRVVAAGVDGVITNDPRIFRTR